MPRRRPALLAAAIVTLAAAGLGAQAQVFRGGTDLVLLSVAVQDSRGRLVPDLGRDDFQIFEDGVPQTITNFSRDVQPIALSLLIDTSASMDRKLVTAQEAAVNFLRQLTPRDVAMVIDFDAQARIRQEFTGDLATLEAAIRSTRAGGPTALYNALYTAVNQLRVIRAEAGPDAEMRRQAIVVLSDGEDTASLIDDVAVLDVLKRSEVIVYAIGLRAASVAARGEFSAAEAALRMMSRETGGRSYFVSEVDQLRGIYAEIADELTSQYTIGYVSTNTARNGAWRAVQVRVNARGATTRTRTGYFGPKAGQ